ncbi:hypothetical protein IJJ36_04570 [Candidatus Saccharibacteria bacterium]|nr:hypothetical protein [Candidatus Saccharibacteria bacterium]
MIIVLVAFLTLVITVATIGMWCLISSLFDLDSFVRRIVIIVLIVVAVVLFLLSVITLNTEVETLNLTVVRSEVQKSWYVIWAEDEYGNISKIDFHDDDIFARLNEGDEITVKLVRLDSRFGVIHDQYYEDIQLIN